MTPQEKAKELIEKYYWTFGDGYLGEQHIQCALIAVDEILSLDSGDSIDKNFWQQVKQEIEKL
jgi:hypothetical protein